MEAVRDSSHLYEVERRARHAERPGFRISELQIGPRQQVPWHYHNNVQDTFYLLQGRLSPRKKFDWSPARPTRFAPGGRTSSRTGAMARRCSWCCRASASTTTFR
jgi:hypothetical protein